MAHAPTATALMALKNMHEKIRRNPATLAANLVFSQVGCIIEEEEDKKEIPLLWHRKENTCES